MTTKKPAVVVDEDATAYYFQWDDKKVCLQDLPASLWEDLRTEAGPDATWVTAVLSPYRLDQEALPILATKCAEHLGVTLPTLTPRVLMECFVLGPDVVPDQWHNGVPVPKAPVSETTTT